MKKLLLAAMLVALVAGAIATESSAATTSPSVVALRTTQHQLDWATRHIRKLNRRNDYLHRYIHHLRREMHPGVVSSPVVRTQTTSYTGGVLTDAQVTSYLLAAGFPQSAVPTMLYYAHRESGNDPRAINSSSGACGLWQLYPCYGGSAWLDPATNARMAYQKYRASGFAPWGG